MKKNVFISPVIGYQKIDVGLSIPQARQQWLAKQFSPQIGDLVCVGTMEEEPFHKLYYPIVGITLEGYLLEKGNVIIYHYPEELSLGDDMDWREANTLYRETDVEWWVVRTRQEKIRYIARGKDSEGDLAVDVFDKHFRHLRTVVTEGLCHGGVMEEIAEALHPEAEDTFLVWVRAITTVDNTEVYDGLVLLIPDIPSNE